ncbi:hypothetical protein DFP73DRAFT_560704 [Morchella snyderi]|nr:hypothetical protein DFP73DRAFT_560704 [Morchella snyderi]
MANNYPDFPQLQLVFEFPYKEYVLSHLKFNDVSSPDQSTLPLIFTVCLILIFTLASPLACRNHEARSTADMSTDRQTSTTQQYIIPPPTGCRDLEDQGSAAAETNSTNRMFNNDQLERWKHALATILPKADYEVQEVDIDEENNSEDSFYSSQMWEGYRVKHEPRSHFIWQHSTDTLFALAIDGSVYGFSIDFECGYLISDTIEGAMSYISNPGTRAKGPARPPWGPYDINAEDMFGDKFGDEDYDSGIDDCDSEFECD